MLSWPLALSSAWTLTDIWLVADIWLVTDICLVADIWLVTSEIAGRLVTRLQHLLSVATFII